MTTPEIIQTASVVVNSGLLLVAVKLTRYASSMEFKVNQMWSVFSRRFGTRTELADPFEGE